MSEHPGLTALHRPKTPFLYEPPVVLGDVRVAPGVRICAHTYMNGGRIESDTYIGRYCSIGFNVAIGTGHHDMSLLSTSSWFDSAALPTVKTVDKERKIKVRIDNDVWIGTGAIILSGVAIGTGAVIGAGAVVTRDVPAYAVVAGVPAQVVKYRFDERTIQRLLATRWWEIDDAVLKQHRLLDIQTSLSFLEQLPEAARTATVASLRRI